MPPAVHRLSLLILPGAPDAPPEALATLVDHLRAGAWLEGDRPGPRPLVHGGFAFARMERFERPRFASNGQGGFRVECPITGENAVPIFNAAFARWRAGGPRELACGCGARHDLDALAYSPPAGFARGWLALVDVGGVQLDPAAEAEVARVLGGVRVVARRG